MRKGMFSVLRKANLISFLKVEGKKKTYFPSLSETVGKIRILKTCENLHLLVQKKS